MTFKNALFAGVAVAGLAVTMAMPANAAGRLNVLCSADNEWCEMMENAFELEHDIDVSMVRKSSGEAYAQVRAEGANPKLDIWWGGTGDPHLQAAAEGLTEPYTSPQMGDLQDWAVRQHKNAGGRTVGIYAGALGIGYNNDLLKEKGLPAPKCWKDLADPVYKGEIQIANPNSSGTSYTTLATFVQLFGEEEAFDLLKAMHKNVNQYTKSGSAPIKAAAVGETTIGITFMHDMIAQIKQGANVTVVSPCEGTGYEVGSMSIIKGARNLDNAKIWAEFALNPRFQSIAEDAHSYQVPSNTKSRVPDGAPRLQDLKLIDYDFAKYGDAETRRALLSRWDNEVKNAPQ
ncbi:MULTISPECIES: ABC transporter substrate-binding protein [Thalassospira]|uniref:Iron ABC transporter substrate-binding protein n=2 Tax=Thalassospira TaxID=168934 RepID=A0A367W8W1_9PROT|nr:MULTISPECIES: ABC transporter substrate-binding protein [Thalassospira]MDG4718108.1 ABC transporter substrate-binding protein [Thalassospira sp. FZY0004]RCK37878.1 iron ABC transporter substrate-binding protein [Thalassospira profundimaris]